MDSIMIDLETFSLDHKAVFPVLCAVMFDSKTFEIGDIFYRVISAGDQLKNGRTIDASTLEWWMKQSEEARSALFDDQRLIASVLFEFRLWCPENSLVWANGIDFDLSILRDAFEGDIPWKYWNQRDLRTVVKLSSIDSKSIPFVGVKHNAKDDCIHQIHLLREAYKALGLHYE